MNKSLLVLLVSLLTLRLPVGLGAEESPWLVFQRATNLYKQIGPTEKVASLCRDIVKRAKEPLLQARAGFLLVKVLSENARDAEAHKLLREMQLGDRKLPPGVRAYAQLVQAQLHLKNSDVEDAKRLFERVAAGSNSAFVRQEARLGIATQFADGENWASVDSVLKKIVAENRTYQNDERVLVLQSRVAVARQDFQEAIAILSQNEGQTALEHLAKTYESAGRPLQAVEVHKNIHDQLPNSTKGEAALFRAGNVFMRTEDWLAARVQLKKLLAQFPETRYKIPILWRLGWIALQLQQFDEAIRTFRNGLASDYRSYFSYMEAETLRRQGRTQPEKYREAIVKYNDLSALNAEDPLAPMAKLQTALTALEEHNRQDALVSLRQFLSLYPKHELAAEATFLVATLQEGKSRNKYLNNILQRHPKSLVFDAALVGLQQQDYESGEYQRVINRHATFPPDSIVDQTQKHWRRIHHLIVAECAYYLQQYDLAQEQYSLARDINEDDLSQKATLGEAWCLLQLGEHELAQTAFTRLKNSSNAEIRVHADYGLATVFRRDQDYEQAIRTYPVRNGSEIRSKLIPLYAKSLYRIAESYFRLEDYATATEIFAKVVRDFPESEMAPQAQFKLAETYFLANHWDSAIAAFQRLLEAYPDHTLSAQATLRIAQSHFNAGQYQKAISGFELFLQYYPGHEKSREAVEGIQLGYYQLGEDKQAVEALQMLVEHSPEAALSADARFRLAQHRLEEGEHQQAIVQFKEVLTLYPGSSYARDAQLALAKAYLAGKDYDSANAEFKRYVHYFPESPEVPEALFHLGVSHFSSQNYSAARDYFTQVVHDSPDGTFYGPSLQNLGWCHYKLGEREEALESFQNYLAEVPEGEDHEKVRLQVARLADELGNFVEEKNILKALQASADKNIVAEASYLLGSTHLESEDWTAAIRAFDHAIKFGGSESWYRLSAMSQLAAIYEAQHEWRNAISTYRLLIASTHEEKWKVEAQERILALEQLIPDATIKGSN